MLNRDNGRDPERDVIGDIIMDVTGLSHQRQNGHLYKQDETNWILLYKMFIKKRSITCYLKGHYLPKS